MLDHHRLSDDETAMLVAVDANALDRKTAARSSLVDRFEALIAAGSVTLHIGAGVEEEMAHPANLGSALSVVPSGKPPAFRPLSASEHIARIRVRAVIQGNAKPGKHESDARHLSEAAEAGCRYFITYDGRILAKRRDLEGFAVPGLEIVTLEEFLERMEQGDTFAD